MWKVFQEKVNSRILRLKLKKDIEFKRVDILLFYRELVLNTYWVFNTLKKYWYWIFNTFSEEVLEKVLILSDWRSNTQYFFQEFFSHFNQKIQNFHAKLIFHSNKILEMKTLLQNQYFDSIYF